MDLYVLAQRFALYFSYTMRLLFGILIIIPLCMGVDAALLHPANYETNSLGELAFLSMGILYVVDRPKNIIYILWQGEIDAETWHHHIQKLNAEPDWPVISRVFVDVQRASTTITMEDLKATTALLRTHPEQIRNKRVAVLAGNLFHRVNTFSPWLERLGVSIIAFNSLFTACAFLGIDPAETVQVLQQLNVSFHNEADS